MPHGPPVPGGNDSLVYQLTAGGNISEFSIRCVSTYLWGSLCGLSGRTKEKHMLLGIIDDSRKVTKLARDSGYRIDALIAFYEELHD